MLKRNFYTNHGFTLVELLVAISIVAILSTAGLVSYRNATSKARDGRRMADLAKVQTALEMYRSNHTGYPGISTWSELITRLNTDGYLSETTIDDPDSNLDYHYHGTGTCGTAEPAFCTGYELCASLTNPPAAASCSVTGYNYRITNP